MTDHERAVDLIMTGELRWCRARLLAGLAGAAKQGVLRDVLGELLPDGDDVASRVEDALRAQGWTQQGPPLPAALRPALEALASAPNDWVFPPKGTRVGRRTGRPERAYASLVRRGYAEADGRGNFRITFVGSAVWQAIGRSVP